MKPYLTQLFEVCEFAKCDADELSAVYDRVVANETANDCFLKAYEEYEQPTCDYGRMIALADDAAKALDVHEYTTELLVFCCLSKRLRERYRERGIDEAVFWNSMVDLRCKADECRAVKGVCGSFVAWWFEGFFNMTRFAFGRLQFELVPFERHYEKDGKRLSPDSKVINVHIPRTGTPLVKDSCDEAYRRAAAFFADQIEGDIAFVCHSWLLYPENETILTKKSNIVRFMKQYDILDVGIDKNKADLWRLFDTEEQHPDRLPTDTTARRLYVQHIKAGGKLGWGFGVFFY